MLLMFAKRPFVICAVCVSVLIASAGYVRAQDLVSAKVLSIEGQVEIRRQPGGQAQMQNIAFKVDDELKAGDVIITGKSGRLSLGLSDGSQAVIAPKTTVVIKDLSQSPRTLFNVIRGKTRIRIEKLGGKPNPYRVNTPTAVIAVRGTIFDVLVEEDKTEVFLHEGEVVVTNLTALDKEVFLLAGQMTRISQRRAPDPPSPFKAGRNDGTFKARDNEENNRRIATGGSRPESGRNGSPSAGASNHNTGRDIGHSASPPNGGANSDFGRGASSPNGSRPNAGPGAGPRSGGRRP
jgi:hypothetical protein